MRGVVTFLATALLLVAPASAAPLRPGELGSREAVLKWINDYRATGDLSKVPAVVHAASKLGAFRDAESAGVFVGFIAGIIGCHPGEAEQLVGKMLPLPPEDQWVLIRAIAYSGLPHWKNLLTRIADRIPSRRVMIDRYLTGKLPPLSEIALERKEPGAWDKIKNYVSFTKQDKATPTPSFDSNPDLLDTLWGYYFATGAPSSIARIIVMLPWSKDKNNVERLTIGSMAKYTLATNAARDGEILALLRAAAGNPSKEVAPILNEVIEAAETVDTGRIRKEALMAVDELRRKGPGYKRDISTWGSIGEGAVSLGCITAAALGQVEFGLPCVVGGALSSAALRYWTQ